MCALAIRTNMVQALLERNMIHNVGTIDRSIRIAAGVALIAATLLGYIGVWGWLGILPLASGLFQVCPAYSLFGLNTCSASSSKTSR